MATELVAILPLLWTKIYMIMTTRKFKAGDWVKLKGNQEAPKMEVVKYVTKKLPFIGISDSTQYLECVYYKNGERITRTVHQNRLLKLTETGGIYKT